MPTRDPGFQPDLDLTLRAFADEIALLPGAATRVWRYEGSVVTGDPDSVQPIPGSYLGPIIRVRRGQKVRITFNNDLPDDDQESIIHWHGLQVPAAMDGHPHNAIAPGRSFVYEFEVIDRAGTYWFHPHPHGLTAEQVNAGLAGLFIVSDDEADAVALPAGEADLPLVIQDRVIDSENQFVYALDMMSAMMGFLGDRVLVNGQPDLVVPVVTRAYRLRVLNGSNARIYKLAWAEGDPLTVIGTDAGLLGAPIERPYVMLAPGERVELWIDLRDRDVGSELHMISQAFSGADGVGGLGA
ncbi:MAG TPA: multicopper oxidase domain-containing protein [Anaerolineales bacterium]|nr:multicopper oxidase domain-containing protein [Anaerolineales bacterium]